MIPTLITRFKITMIKRSVELYNRASTEAKGTNEFLREYVKLKREINEV